MLAARVSSRARIAEPSGAERGGASDCPHRATPSASAGSSNGERGARREADGTFDRRGGGEACFPSTSSDSSIRPPPPCPSHSHSQFETGRSPHTALHSHSRVQTAQHCTVSNLRQALLTASSSSLTSDEKSRAESNSVERYALDSHSHSLSVLFRCEAMRSGGGGSEDCTRKQEAMGNTGNERRALCRLRARCFGALALASHRVHL